MTAHWEFTYGAERVKEVVEHDLNGRIEFVAQNVQDRGLRRPGVHALRAARA